QRAGERSPARSADGPWPARDLRAGRREGRDTLRRLAASQCWACRPGLGDPPNPSGGGDREMNRVLERPPRSSALEERRRVTALVSRLWLGLPAGSLIVPIAACIVLALVWTWPVGWISIAVVVAGLIAAVLVGVHHAEVIALRVGEPFGTLVLALVVTVI